MGRAPPTWDRIDPVRMGTVTLVALFFAATTCGCRPSTIAEAEAKQDVQWLSANGTPEAILALGRLADKNAQAEGLLAARSAYDPIVFRAAWAAILRGAAWGPAMLRAALADPSRAEDAAAALPHHDPRSAEFTPDLETALERLAASPRNGAIASALASIGPPAHAAVERRLTDGASRGAMCRGIATCDASPDARALLLSVPETSRDHASCVAAAVKLTAEDDVALHWLARIGEPGIMGAASKSESMTCPRLHLLWTEALASRGAESYSALVVPLAGALTRCPEELDGVVADAINRMPKTDALAVGAIDPFGTSGPRLRATCAALPAAAGNAKAAPIIRERARDALAHACLSL